MLCALIMAGGKGTRFWPLSTEEKPKQFLNLIGDETMIQMTVNRIKPIIPIERIFVCTGEMYVDLVKKQLPELPDRNIIVEPEGRNTTPCIALSAFVVKRYYKDLTMVVLPSDHLINDEEEFRRIILEADTFIKNNNNAIITLGMEPTRAETGYGYIKCSEERNKLIKSEVVKVEKFVEKPNEELANEYVSSGNYLWNGGMFIWTVENILCEISKYSSSIFESLHNIQDVQEEKLQDLINREYMNMEAISIDYSVLEKSKEIYVIPSDFGWDDIGSWEAIERHTIKDDFGNVVIGQATSLKGNNNLLVSSNHRVIVEGLSDIYVIENDGKIIIGQKSNVVNAKELRNIV
ncbi:MAG: mannose-1-phosphate guanylyltransferase [Clostridium sp.]|uniref:mannose-1-phosphate guanylyltransferase n=1 Tax=Clostridium sp. TaxID=1506 RepID=UPI00290C6EBE|nr:mannose-1-phosphate guanylyltransferase [Clostridium sp.]MDU5109597.1 mannose-1-phosphate guanylyltransferase [Clostridium sp.]